MSSEIRCNMSKAVMAIRGLRALSSMAAQYASFSVATGRSSGYPQEAFDHVAQSVRRVAQAEQELIDSVIANIVADIAALENLDAGIAQQLFAVGDD